MYIYIYISYHVIHNINHMIVAYSHWSILNNNINSQSSSQRWLRDISNTIWFLCIYIHWTYMYHISIQANVYIHITSYHFNHNIQSYDCFSYNHRNVCIHIAFNNCIISLSHKEMQAVHQIKYDSHTLVLTVYVYISSYYNNMIYI